MPRKRKRQRPRTPGGAFGAASGPANMPAVEATTPRDVLDADERKRLVVDTWTRLLNAGARKKKRFRDDGRKVSAYFKNVDGSHFFSKPEVARWAQLDGVVAVPVNMAFQVRGWLGPELYQRNPTRTVTCRTKDGIGAAMATAVGRYLNFTPNEVNLANEIRAGIDEALLLGRGAAYHGVDPETNLVASWYISIEDVLIDPDARRIEDAYWIAWRQRLPLWKVRQLYPGTAAGLERGDSLSENKRACLDIDEEERTKDATDEDPVYTGGASNDLVTVWEVWSKMGSGFRAREVAKEHRGYDEGSRFRKVVIVPGYERPLYEGEWETPLYLDRGWPITFLDLTPTINELWPTSLMTAAMPHQDAANLLSTIAMAKAKEHAREIYGVSGGIDPSEEKKIRQGGLSEMVRIEPTDMTGNINEIVTRFDPGTISPEILNERAWHLDQFGQVTGLMPIMKGEVSEQQIRSATEADVRDKNARTRITDMSERVEDWASRMARAEGILVRLELEPDEVERVLGEPEDTELGYLIAMSSLGVEIPVRLRPEDPDAADAPLDLETLSPRCGTYFESPQDAIACAAELYLSLPQINEERVARGQAPVLIDKVVIRPVTVHDLWRDTAYMSAEAICRELTFRVEAGSSKRPDHNNEITKANTLMTLVGQPALQAAQPALAQLAGDPSALIGTYNKALRAIYDGMQFSERGRVYMPLPPPMVPTMEPQPGEPGAKPEKGQGQGPPAGAGAPGQGRVPDGDAGFSFVGGPGGINAPRMAGAGRN